MNRYFLRDVALLVAGLMTFLFVVGYSIGEPDLLLSDPWSYAPILFMCIVYLYVMRRMGRMS